MSRRERTPSDRLAVLLAVALLALACTPTATTPSARPSTAAATPGGASPSPTPPSEPSQPPARWADCGGGFQCVTLRVPRDYDDPGGPRFDIALVRRPANRADERIGSLVINPGGPGGSGVEFVRTGADFFGTDLLDRFDLVGFDPRGVNLSSQVRCLSSLDGHFEVDPTPDDAAEIDALAAEARRFAEACRERNADALPFLSTANVVRDLDQIRQAVGDDQLTYLGFSYGTLIGALYAERYPDRVRALALDGAIDPALDLEAFRGGQARAFEAALGHFFDRCAARTSCPFHENGRTEAAFDALMAAIDEEPIPVLNGRDRRQVGPGMAHGAVLSALYSEQGWNVLAAGLALAKAGDGTILLQMSDPFRGRKPNGTYSNMYDAYTANTCLDFPVPPDVAGFTAIGDSLLTDAPHFARHIAYNDLECAYWAAPAERTPAAVAAEGAPPILVVGSTGDTATPIAWAEALAVELESGVLLTREGEGHTGYGFSRCVRDAVDAYLAELDLPEAGLTCQ